MKNFKAFLPWLKGSKGLAILSLAFAFLSTTSKLAIPFIAGKAVNVIISEGVGVDLSIYLILMCLFLAIGTLFRYIFDITTAVVGQRVIKDMRKSLFDSYLETSIADIDQKSRGDLTQRLVNDIENVQTGLLSGFAALYDGIVAIAITIVFMFILNWALALIVVLLTPLSLLVSRFVSRFNTKHFKSQAKASGLASAFANETLNNSIAIQTLGVSKEREKEFDALSDEYRKNTFKANLGAALINPSTRLINALINATLILVGALFIVKDVNLGMVFLVGDLSAFLTYASSFMQPFNEVSNVMSEIGYALSSFNRINEAVNMPKDINDGKKKIEKEIETLEAEDVTFSYDGKRTIISNLSLEVKKGQKIAFVGPTGCGKTTIINLLMRFFDPQKGDFKINGVPTREIDKKSLREHVGMVLQETWIFSGTVFENIAYAKEGATLEEVKKAAKKAQAAGFIERLPNGYDTFISDSSGLSVGEKQLICVARVMMLEPEIVILDEATSNIDIRTEKLLNDSFKSLFEGRTSLVVAHRLSTIISSDLIVVLKDGAIMESGSHNELMKKKGFYYDLFNAQFN
ncbi:MAG: ABC transporter ATP-binding protein/permease [Bacilli bacterium]|nr:ABC transporter ATP-binding protein/permease [Bacilli bacterium]